MQVRHVVFLLALLFANGDAGPVQLRVFSTFSTLTGDFGGLAEAHRVCQVEGDRLNAQTDQPREWKAILASCEDGVARRCSPASMPSSLHGVLQFVNVRGELLGNSSAELFATTGSGQIGGTLGGVLHPLLLPNGALPLPGEVDTAWTGYNAAGNAEPAGHQCLLHDTSSHEKSWRNANSDATGTIARIVVAEKQEEFLASKYAAVAGNHLGGDDDEHDSDVEMKDFSDALVSPFELAVSGGQPIVPLSQERGRDGTIVHSWWMAFVAPCNQYHRLICVEQPIFTSTQNGLPVAKGLPAAQYDGPSRLQTTPLADTCVQSRSSAGNQGYLTDNFLCCGQRGVIHAVSDRVLVCSWTSNAGIEYTSSAFAAVQMVPEMDCFCECTVMF
ncbi:hypothetical protein CAOG_02823 [Capsaspora owczarzaki ATCC 30864]|uniref:C-type lectin domain-containing protein n=1 Tax=Capsaspora owczarzaki (strain ATCC 30864) TaxID=595528 RepID=A0A0D2WN37_CAPO3|nr:hypothetical protein CAOG_02823 [Capsaspora owczarzaki ATCC 30864]KJE91728.1 hypothetical protein CAOG_002823 [Capsaspora owczarzaki ATCC 30864]|eukprot:XP_004348636.1 hypothetical protein CAOG_02823 [Capsaspora owczarzaki ATCC 30864]